MYDSIRASTAARRGCLGAIERQRLALTGMGRDGEGGDQRNLLPFDLEHRGLSVLVQLPGFRDRQNRKQPALGRAVQRPVRALELHVPGSAPTVATTAPNWPSKGEGPNKKSRRGA